MTKSLLLFKRKLTKKARANQLKIELLFVAKRKRGISRGQLVFGY